MYLSSVGNSRLLYDAKSWNLKNVYGPYSGLIRDISWSYDGKYLLQVDPEGIVSILCPTEQKGSTGVATHILPYVSSWSAVFHRDDYKHIAIGTKDGKVVFWDTINRRMTTPFPEQSQQSSVEMISYNNDNTLLAATKQNGETTIYSLLSYNSVHTVKPPSTKGISAMKFCPESRCVLGISTNEGHIFLRNIALNKDQVVFHNVHTAKVSGFTFSKVNMHVMLSSGYDKIINIYDTRLQNIVSTKCTDCILTSIATNSDYQVALGTLNGLIDVYDMRDMDAPLKVLKGHKGAISRLSYQPVNDNSIQAEFSIKVGDSTEQSSSFSDMFSDSLFKSGQEKSTPDNLKKHIFYAYNNVNLGMVSTPKAKEYIEEECIDLTSTIKILKEQIPDECNNVSLDMRTKGDLKDFIKLSLSELSYKDRSYFLKILMELTKTNLVFKKQLSNMSEQIQHLLQNQNALDNTQKILALRISNLLSMSNILKEQIPDECKNVSLNVIATPREIDLPPASNKLNLNIPEECNNISLDVGAKDDLKDFIKLLLSEVSDEERSSFLKIMMELTKTNLFLKKELFNMSEQMQGLLQSQNASVETQRKLVLQIAKLKKAQKDPLLYVCRWL